MNEEQHNQTEGNDSMGKILMKIFALGAACIISAWGILKVLEQF
jgi:hypothetical protein